MPSSVRENAKPPENRCGWRASHGHGHRSLSRTSGGRPSSKLSMNRAPLAVVVARLAHNSSAGTQYRRKAERRKGDLGRRPEREMEPEMERNSSSSDFSAAQAEAE